MPGRMPERGRDAGGGRIEARRQSFKGLGPEPIGHVYKGLLDQTGLRAEGLVLGLAGTKNLEPEGTLATLEALLTKRNQGCSTGPRSIRTPSGSPQSSGRWVKVRRRDPVASTWPAGWRRVRMIRARGSG